MRHRNLLSTATALGLVLCAPAIAQTAPPLRTPLKSASKPVPKPAPRPVSTPGATDTVIVLGHGQTRQVQTMSAKELGQTVPGASPFLALSRLPGVAYETSDPYGLYEWSQQVTVRGFTTGYLGYTFDGVPLGNLNYSNDNGLSIGRAVSSENNGPATLAQGTGALGTNSTNNLGGTFEFTSIDPTKKRGVDILGSVGSSDTYHAFIRLNSGTLPGNGQFYVSYGYTTSQKWKGWGPQTQHQVNAKLVQPITPHVTLTVFGDYTDHRETNYQNMSLSLINRLGYNWDNLTRNYPLALQLADIYRSALKNHTTPTYPAPFKTLDDAYYNAGMLRQDVLGYGRLDYDLLPGLTGSTTIYGHLDAGQGLWATPYQASPAAYGGAPISNRTTEYDIHREGVFTNLAYHIANHKIESGFWFENNEFEQPRRFYGMPLTNPGPYLRWYQNPFKTQFLYAFDTKTYQFHIQDTWKVTPDWKINYGFKSVVATSTDNTTEGTQLLNGKITASDGFLPQVGVVYKINAHNELFGDFSRNMRTYEASAFAGPFATTQNGFDYLKPRVKPETENTEEAGYRYYNHDIQFTTTGYYVEFQNRLLQTTIGAAILGSPSVLSNVGSVTSRGIETALNWNVWGHWSLYGSYAYNDAHYDNNVYDPAGKLSIASAGKQVVVAPRNIANAQIGYDDGSWWGTVNAQYQSRRFYTYDNTAPVAGFLIGNLTAGYRVHRQGWLNGTEAQLNIINLGNKKYISTVGSSAFYNSDPSGTAQTLLVGTPRMAFFTIKKHF